VGARYGLGPKWWRCSTAAAWQADMKHNDALPVIEVDPETYEVRADGVHLTCEPASGATAADEANEVFLSNHVANRASRAQGQAFLMAAEATLNSSECAALREQLPYAHVAVAFGAALPFELDDVRQLFLFGAVRGALSALVRLGALGPLRAQRLLYELHPHLNAVLAATRGRSIDEATSISPLLELAQASHDRLYSRLFQS
jgi:urease accessory protein